MSSVPKTTPAPTTPVPTTITTTLGTTTPYVPYNCAKKVDLVLVTDASSSVFEQWEKMKTFLKELVQRFTVSPEHANVGAVTYSSANKQMMNSDLVDDLFFIDIALGRCQKSKEVEFVLSFIVLSIFVKL